MRKGKGFALLALALAAASACWLRRAEYGHRAGPVAVAVSSSVSTVAENSAASAVVGKPSAPKSSRVERPRADADLAAPPVSSCQATGGRRIETTGSDLEFLADSHRPSGISLQAWRAEKNALMDVLSSRRQPPAELAGILIAVSGDPEQDVVVRDYALQHMVSIYSSAVSDRGRMQEALFRALDEKRSSLPGTALLALNRLARDYPDVDGDRLEARALALAGDEDCGAMGRAAAFQVCAALDVQEVAPLAQAVVAAPGSPFLRRSARATLERLNQHHSELAAAGGTTSPREDCHDCP